jgi:hypothetical protein
MTEKKPNITGTHIPHGDKKVATDAISVLEMRNIRLMVRQTASLVANHGKIKEQPGQFWAANFEDRTIFWRPTSSLPPNDVLTEDELLFLVVHEAGHLNWTGRWDCPKDFDFDKWHLFINAVEDIREERLTVHDGFAGFQTYRMKVAPKFLGWHKKQDGTQYSLADQVWINWHCTEYGLEPDFGTDKAIEFAKKTWPVVDSLFHSKSTADLAKGMEPIYRELMEHDPSLGGDGKPMAEKIQEMLQDDGTVMVMGESVGGSSPSDFPERSQGNMNINSKSSADQLETMSNGAQGKAKIVLKEAADQERREQAQGNDRARNLVGPSKAEESSMPGSGIGYSGPTKHRRYDNSWNEARVDVRQHINRLSRKLVTTLRNNAEDEWMPGLRRGTLDMSQAHKSLVGSVNVFKDRKDEGQPEYLFAVTVDVSSSQSGRAKPLLECTVLVAESLWMARQRMMIVPWCHHPEDPMNFGDSLREHKGHLGATISRPSGSTYEAPALVQVQDQMRRFPGMPRCMITLTDGQTSNIPESRQVIGEMIDQGVDCIGIGICHEPPKHYPKQIRVDDPQQLVNILPRLIIERVPKGR